MKTSIWLTVALGAAVTLSAQTADQTQTRTRTRTPSATCDPANPTATKSQDRLRLKDGSFGQTPGSQTGQRLGQSSGTRGGRGR